MLIFRQADYIIRNSMIYLPKVNIHINHIYYRIKTILPFPVCSG